MCYDFTIECIVEFGNYSDILGESESMICSITSRERHIQQE